MPDSATIRTINISSLRCPVNISGDFGILPLSGEKAPEILAVSFKTKFFALLITTAGKAEVTLDGTCHPVSRGNVVFINYNQVGRLERSEEHTSELQSRENLVCRLLLEKKKKKNKESRIT